MFDLSSQAYSCSPKSHGKLEDSGQLCDKWNSAVCFVFYTTPLILSTVQTKKLMLKWTAVLNINPNYTNSASDPPAWWRLELRQARRGPESHISTCTRIWGWQRRVLGKLVYAIPICLSFPHRAPGRAQPDALVTQVCCGHGLTCGDQRLFGLLLQLPRALLLVQLARVLFSGR